jgi:putative ABC transport system permease protein
VGFVLLIACANHGSLFLARSASRLKELAVRRALGAGRWQVVRPIVADSLAVTAAGGVCGLVLASWLARAQLTIGGPYSARRHGRRQLAHCAVLAGGISDIRADVRRRARVSCRPHRRGRRTERRRAQRSRHSTAARSAPSSGDRVLMLLVTAGLLMKSFWRLGPRFDRLMWRPYEPSSAPATATSAGS